MRSNIGVLEGENDVVSRYPRLHELLRDTVLSAVVLNPNLAVANVNVQNAAVDAIRTIPT